MQRWLRHITKDVVASTIGAVSFMFCGFLAWHAIHPPLVNAAVWAPWVMLAWERATERFTARRVAATSICLTMIALQGHQQMLWIVMLMLGGLGLGRVLTGSQWPRVLLVTAAAIGGCVGLAAVQRSPLRRFARRERDFLVSCHT